MITAECHGLDVTDIPSRSSRRCGQVHDDHARSGALDCERRGEVLVWGSSLTLRQSASAGLRAMTGTASPVEAVSKWDSLIA